METLAMRVNKRIEKIAPSSTLAITARAKELKAEGKDVVNFAAGEPDFNTPKEITAAAVKAMEAGQTKYTPSIGTVDLRKAIAEKLKKDNGLDYTPAQIAVSSGAKHSLYCAIMVLCDEGDEVLIPAPYWVSYPEQVKLAGAISKILETTAQSEFKITAKQLEENISDKTRVLILNSPSNPTGSVYSRKELEEIAQVCVKHSIYVISDEIYEKLIYDKQEYTSIASLGNEIYNLTITINGVSKAYSMTGWRIGYTAASKEIVTYIKNFQDHSTSCPSSISQAAALAALKLPDDIVNGMRDEFEKRRGIIMAGFDKIPEISYVKPGGAFYLYCDISKLGNSMDVAKRILDDVNVAFIPGEGFGSPGFARLSFATSIERIEEGVKRIAGWIKNSS